MKEKLINQVLFSMQGLMEDSLLAELKTVLQNVLQLYEITQERQELRTVDDSWREDLEDYLMAKALEGRSVKTIERYRYELYRMLSYVNKAVGRINSEDISGYMRAYKKLRKVGNQTLKNVRTVYSGFFTWLHIRGRVSCNIMAMVGQVKVERTLKKPFSDEERERLFRSCETLRDKAIIEFLYSTAVRVSELEGLNRSDIRWNNKDLIVMGKGAKERRVYLNEKTNMYLREYLDGRTDDNEALFVSLRHPYNRLSKQGIEALAARIGKRAEVPNTHPHRFRRTAATNSLNRGMPLQEVATILGHAKLETTMIYCTVEQESVQLHHKKYLSA